MSEIKQNIDQVIEDVASGYGSRPDDVIVNNFSKEEMILIEETELASTILATSKSNVVSFDSISNVTSLNGQCATPSTPECNNIPSDKNDVSPLGNSGIKIPSLILADPKKDHEPLSKKSLLKRPKQIRKKKILSKFPERLFKIANDGILVKWTDDGLAFVVEEFEDFGEKMNKLYPAFLHVPSFYNFRRMLRDYGFEFTIIRRQKHVGHKIKYRHSLFTKDSNLQDFLNISQMKRDRQEYIRVLRRQAPVSRDMSPSTSTPHRRRTSWKMSLVNKRFQSKRQSFIPGDYDSDSSFSSLLCNDESLNNSMVSTLESHEQVLTKPLWTPDSFRLLQMFARNELDEADQADLMLRQLYNCHARVSRGTWETILEKVNSLVFDELPPFPESHSCDFSEFIQVPFDKM